MKTSEDWRKTIIEQMSMVDMYQMSFDIAIDALAALMVDYQKTSKKFIDSGGNHVVAHTNKNGSTNPVKNPYYLVIEKQRDTILKYTAELGLTPSGFKRVKGEGAELTSNPGVDVLLLELENSMPG